jgi:hypothetical protein
MKRLIIFSIVALSTFSFGVALDRLSKGPADAAPKIQKLEPVTPFVVNTLPTFTLVPPPNTTSAPDCPEAAPVASPTPDLIFNYDPLNFDPVGSYVLTGDGKREFAELAYLELWRGEDSEGPGYIGFRTTENESQVVVVALVSKKRLFFRTKSASEVGPGYLFDGEFLRGNVVSDAPSGKAVLGGTLIKFRNGRKIIERTVSFRVEHIGC